MDEVIEKVIDLSEFKPHPRNYNKHPAEQIEKLRISLRKFGQVRNIVVWRKWFVAGHGVAEAAIAEGRATLRANVIPDSWSEESVLAYLVADNELGKLSNPDDAALAALIDDVRQYDDELFAAMGFDQERFDELLKGIMSADEPAPLADPGDLTDKAQELREKWQTESGQLWQLGEHRLLCGDSTDPAVVQRLMAGERAILFATDPPYLVDYDGNNHPHKFGKKDGNKDWSDTYKDWDRADQGGGLYEGFISVAIEHAIHKNAAWYCWHASRRQAMLEVVWEKYGAFVHQQIIWAKDRPVLTRSWYMWKHEPCFFGWVRGNEPPRRSKDYPHSVWEFATIAPGTETLHPTMKPVELFQIPMQQHTLAGELCYEPFSGSGTQILAAESLKRRCYAVERAPEFVAVALERWSVATGGEPALLK